MAFVIADRVRESSTTAGTGALTLSGAVSGYQTFLAGIGNGNTTYYCITNTSAGLWEVGLGSPTAGVLSRTTVLASSNANSLVSFSGTLDVFVTYPSEIAVQRTDIQSNKWVSGADTGTANTYKPTITPAPTVATNTMFLWPAANSNSGASTVQINGAGTVYNLYGLGGVALQGGEIVANGVCAAVYDGTQFVLLYCTGGALQVGTATQNQQAVTYAQLQAAGAPQFLLFNAGVI